MRLLTPFLQDDRALEKVGNWYMAMFWILTLAFYVSLGREGAQASLGLLTCCTAGLACVLVRRARNLRATSLNHLLVSATVPIVGLLLRVDDLIKAGRDWRASVALMLICIEGFDDAVRLVAPEQLIGTIRKQLNESSDSLVFQIDKRTLAVVERGEEVVAHLDRISDDVQRSFRAHRAANLALVPARLTVGIAVADKGRTSAAGLFATARAAVELAEANRMDIFVRQV